MKRNLIIFAMLLCLLLCVALLSSCGKDKPSEHEHAWDDGQTTALSPCEGETVYTCTICGATKTEPYEHHVWSEETRLVTLPTDSAAGQCERICTVCKKTGGIVSMKNADYAAKVLGLITEINSFDTNDFGGSKITIDLVAEAKAVAKKEGKSFTPYAAPEKTPLAEHPRVLINKSDLDGIRAALKDERNREAAALYFEAVANPTDGDLGKAVYHEKGTFYYMNGTYNYDEQVLENIQALALDYQLTGNEISGYAAIRAIENYIVTLDVVNFSACGERQYGSIMYVAACVYDWCHDLLSSIDCLRIVSGIEHKIVAGSHMEVGFPPYKQGSVSGHGCEYQILRDYLAFAIAIYDEYPGWWNFVGGRIYQDYVPVRQEFYHAGMVPQGISLYVRPRYASDLFAAWLLKAGVGELHYNAEEMKQVMRTVYSYELPYDYGFASGDDHDETIDGNFFNYGLPALISSYLFNDETMRAQLESREACFTKFWDERQDCFEYPSVTEYLICSSSGVKAADDVHKDMDLLLYNGGWLGQTIARNNWGKDQTAVLMKIGVRTGANHDHSDAGQFQIWYKTMLAGDTGVYDSYGDTHFRKYHQATIAHNCILIGTNGQKHPGEVSNLKSWTSGNHETGVVTGHENGYADDAKTVPLYAYIAGDLTKAYEEVASEVERRMLAVFDTKNEEVPLFFFVYDSVTATSATNQKTFLLHTKAEPTVLGNTVTEECNGARLVLQSVFGGDKIVKVGGGVGKNYLIDGQQVEPTSSDDGFWGRVEISAKAGNKTDQMLNVMYVCDADKSPMGALATSISTDAVKGAAIGQIAAVFVTNKTRRTEAFDFSVTRNGDVTYYVSGVAAGNWNVSVGSYSATVTATDDGGLLVFTAPAGTVSLSRAN